jgi:hypothetical protein
MKGETKMKKRNSLVITLLVVVMSLVAVIPASAWTYGCTPGYWKQEQHFDSWPAQVCKEFDDLGVCILWMDITTETAFSDVFGVGPNMSLLDALSAKNKDYPGGEAALMRHAVAALLNDVTMEYPMTAQPWVVYAYGDGGFEYVKDKFEELNEAGCPLN